MHAAQRSVAVESGWSRALSPGSSPAWSPKSPLQPWRQHDCVWRHQRRKRRHAALRCGQPTASRRVARSDWLGSRYYET